jgi:putative SOS response-associated peptidase YedK
VYAALTEFGKNDQLATFFPIDATEAALVASYPIDPFKQVLAIVHHQGKNRLERLHWGLVPFWATDTRMGRRLINARAESVATKPSFRDAFKRRRCLIPATGFYEWPDEKGNKPPVCFTLPDRRPFAFAGIWERWNDRGNADAIYLSCTIITTVASQSVAPVHQRMPVILNPVVYSIWLDSENHNTRALETILKTDILGELIYRPVSRPVNPTANNRPVNTRPMAQMHLDFKVN